MCQTIRRSVFVLAMLSIGLVVSIPGSVLARVTLTVVEGRADLLDDVEGEEPRPDSAGNLHFHHVLAQGDFSLQGDGIAIDGTQTLVLNGSVDRSFSGPFSGTFTVRTLLEGQDTVIWEGHVHGQVVHLLFTGRITAHGQGPFAGMLLQLDVQEDDPTPENPNPETFDLTGWILDPQGQ